MKKLFNILCLLLLATLSFSAQTKYEKDFLEFWNDFNDNFAYFDKRATDWQKVKEIYQPQAAKITNDLEFIEFLEKVTHELYNGHIFLNTNLETSNRIIPSGADIWAELVGDIAVIKDLRQNSKAELSGLRAGMKILKFNDKPFKPQLQTFLPKSVANFTPEMYEYAVNMLLAGTHNKPRKITVEINGAEKDFYPDNFLPKVENKLLETKVLDRNIGYIKINNSLFNYDLIKEFDAAVNSLFSTKAIILDLTETPSGGNTTVARAIMSRFIEREMPYQKHSLPREEKRFGLKRSWVEYVSPRGRIYKNPVIITVSRWTGSMGEGLAIGFDGMKRAKIVGTRMAGLIGAIEDFQMTETKIGYTIPTEKLFHINGTPREDFLPPYLTENTNLTMKKALSLMRANRR